MHPVTQLILDKTKGIFGSDLRGNHMFDYRLCLGAMLHVQQNMSAPYYSFMNENHPEAFKREVSNEVGVLDRHIGICGNHVQAFSLILGELGYKTRELQIFHALEGTNVIQGHVIAEVFFGEAWRMFDVTWGWHPYMQNTENVLSFKQTQTEPFSKCINMLDPWTNNALRNSEEAVWAYLERQEYGVLYANDGMITPPFDASEKKFVIDGLPKHMGWTKSFRGNDGNVGYRLLMPDSKLSHRIAIDFDQVAWSSDISGQVDFPLWVIANGEKIPFEDRITFTTKEGVVELAFESKKGAKPYVLLGSIGCQSIPAP